MCQLWKTNTSKLLMTLIQLRLIRIAVWSRSIDSLIYTDTDSLCFYLFTLTEHIQHLLHMYPWVLYPWLPAAYWFFLNPWVQEPMGSWQYINLQPHSLTGYFTTSKSNWWRQTSQKPWSWYTSDPRQSPLFAYSLPLLLWFCLHVLSSWISKWWHVSLSITLNHYCSIPTTCIKLGGHLILYYLSSLPYDLILAKLHTNSFFKRMKMIRS